MLGRALTSRTETTCPCGMSWPRSNKTHSTITIIARLVSEIVLFKELMNINDNGGTYSSWIMCFSMTQHAATETMITSFKASKRLLDEDRLLLLASHRIT